MLLAADGGSFWSLGLNGERERELHHSDAFACRIYIHTDPLPSHNHHRPRTGGRLHSASAMPPHPIFDDIDNGDLEAVKARVLADTGVLWERGQYGRTVLAHAISCGKPAIALWLIDHQRAQNLRVGDLYGPSILIRASEKGPLAITQALVAAGVQFPVLRTGWTPLHASVCCHHPDILAFLLTLPAGKDSIDSEALFRHAPLHCLQSWV